MSPDLREPGFISRPLPSYTTAPPLKSFPLPERGDAAQALSKGSLASGSSFSSHYKPIKYGTGKYADTELVPQPSDDPEDPLNWPRWRRDLNLVSLLFMVGLIGGMKTAFVTTSGSLVAHYGVSSAAIGALTGGPIILSTVTGLAASIGAKIVGKRPIYLASTLFIFIGTLVNMTAAADSYSVCLRARMLQGLGWGAFDTLVMGSIQDTYYEHERNLPVTTYNLLCIATTWASPLFGGLASRNGGSFTTQFRIISTFYIVAFPLLAFGAPETAFDRGRASSPPPLPTLNSWQPWRLRHKYNSETAVKYLKKMKPYSFRAPVKLPTLLQTPRAMIAPTTLLLFTLSFIPFGALWGLATSVSILTTPPPLNLSPASTGVIMVGPWVISSMVVGGFCFYRGLYEKFTKSVRYMIVGAGTMLSITGLLSFGLGIHNFMTARPTSNMPFFTQDTASQISLPLLSLQLGILAAGNYVLETMTRPMLVRSASFTSSTLTVAQRSIGDLHTAVTLLRNFAAGIFVLAMPSAVSVFGQLKNTVIGLVTVQIFVTGGLMAAWWFYDEAIWRADGRIMGLVNLSMMKESASFFETD